MPFMHSYNALIQCEHRPRQYNRRTRRDEHQAQRMREFVGAVADEQGFRCQVERLGQPVPEFPGLFLRVSIDGDAYEPISQLALELGRKVERTLVLIELDGRHIITGDDVRALASDSGPDAVNYSLQSILHDD